MCECGFFLVQVERHQTNASANKIGAEWLPAPRTNTNQAATFRLSLLFLLLSSEEVIQDSAGVPSSCVCVCVCARESIAVLHYVSWAGCHRTSGVTLPVSINRWQHTISHDGRIYVGLVCLDLVASFFYIFHMYISVTRVSWQMLTVCKRKKNKNKQ